MTLLHQAAQKAVEALKELHEAHLAKFPPAKAGSAAQTAWSERRANAHDRAEVVIATLEATLQQEVPSGWMPIESAPKDGHLLLLATDKGVIVVGKRNKHLHIWVEADGRETPRHITHWMPVPSAPTALQQQEVPREPVAADAKSVLEQVANAPNEENCAMCNGRGFYGIPGQRCSFCKGTGRVQWRSAPDAASPSTTRQQEVGSGWKLVPVEPTPEMITAYLRANDAYWKRTDELPAPPNKWRAGTPSDATAESYRAMLAAAPSTPEKAGGVPARTYLHASRVDALIAVIEGECDGLAVTREHAEAILHYVDGNAPPVGMAPCSLCASHDLCKQHGCAGKALERERAARGVPAVAPVRLVEGPPRDFGQAQDRYGEHMDRPAPALPSPIPHPLPAQHNDGGEHG